MSPQASATAMSTGTDSNVMPESHQSKRFASYKDLGLYVQKELGPGHDFQRMDPDEVGRVAAPKLAADGFMVIEDYDQINWLNTLANLFSKKTPEGYDAPGDLIETTRDVLASGAHLLTTDPFARGDSQRGQPPGVIRQLASLAAGGIGVLGERGAIELPGQRTALLPSLARLGEQLPAPALLTRVDKRPMTIKPTITEEDKELAKQFGRAWRETLTPGMIEKRAAQALLSIFDVVPMAPGKFMPAKHLIPPAKKLIGSTVEAVKKKVTDSKAHKGLLEGVREAGRRMKVGDRDLSVDVIANVLGVSSSRPAEWVAQLLETTRKRGEDFKQVLRKYRVMDKADLADEIQRKTFGAMDILEDNAQKEYMRATSNFFDAPKSPGAELLDITEVQGSITKVLNDFGVSVDAAGNLDWSGAGRLLSDSPISKIGPTRRTLEAAFKEILSVPQGQQARMTWSRSGAKVEIPASPAPPNKMTVKELHLVRKALDDALSTLDPTAGISAMGFGALQRAKNKVGDFLDESVEGYSEAMEGYRRHVVTRDEMMNFDLQPGQIDKYGLIRGGTQEGVLRKLRGSIDDSHVAAKRHVALRSLEKLTGVPHLVDMQLAALAQDFMGGGLLVRHELIQIAKVAAGGGLAGGVLGMAVGGAAGAVAGAAATGGVMGAIRLLPAVAMFSPRASSEFIIGMVGKPDVLKRLGREKINEISARFERMSKALHRMDRLTGGKLRLKSQAWSVGQLMDRLDVGRESEEDYKKRWNKN
jgi:hypothetical protein